MSKLVKQAAQGKAADWLFLQVNPAFEMQTGMQGSVGKRMRSWSRIMRSIGLKLSAKVALTAEPVRFVDQAKAMGGMWFDLYAFRVGGTDSPKVAINFTEISKRKKAASVSTPAFRSSTAMASPSDRFCLMDMKPRQLTDREKRLLQEYANEVMEKIAKREPQTPAAIAPIANAGA